MNTENEAEVTKDGALATVLAIDAALEAGIAAADIAAVLEAGHYRLLARSCGFGVEGACRQ